MSIRRARRMTDMARASCNGGADNKGCIWLWPDHIGRDWSERPVTVRIQARLHAEESGHEAVVETTGGTVYDGRNR
jgi:hypothetical protein